jgi:putative cell wall-binding protein
MRRLGNEGSIYGGGSLVEAEVLAEKLVEADETGNGDVIDEAAEDTLYAKWETIEETRHRMERIQQKAEKEREERTRKNLSSLLGFE